MSDSERVTRSTLTCDLVVAVSPGVRSDPCFFSRLPLPRGRPPGDRLRLGPQLPGGAPVAGPVRSSRPAGVGLLPYAGAPFACVPRWALLPPLPVAGKGVARG